MFCCGCVNLAAQTMQADVKVPYVCDAAAAALRTFATSPPEYSAGWYLHASLLLLASLKRCLQRLHVISDVDAAACGVELLFAANVDASRLLAMRGHAVLL